MSWELSAHSDGLRPDPGNPGGRLPNSRYSGARSLRTGFRRQPLAKYYLCGVLKLLIIIVVLYLGYRLFVGPPLLGERNQEPPVKSEDDDGYADYEEIS